MQAYCRIYVVAVGFISFNQILYDIPTSDHTKIHTLVYLSHLQEINYVCPAKLITYCIINCHIRVYVINVDILIRVQVHVHVAYIIIMLEYGLFKYGLLFTTNENTPTQITHGRDDELRSMRYALTSLHGLKQASLKKLK